MKKVAVGIDIGGINTAFGLVDAAGNVITTGSIPTESKIEIKQFLSKLYTAIDRLVESNGGEFDILGIGIGAPNGNYNCGTIEYAANLGWEGIVPVVDYFKEHYAYNTIVLTNDANAAAIGEMIYGGAKDIKDFMFITLGTGLGSGLVVNGRMVYGHDGFAGEIGHSTVVENGRLCGCGRRGCLETYASATGIRRTAFELLADTNDTESELAKYSFNQLDSKIIYDAACNGDKIAKQAFEFTGKILGKALANSVAHNSPKAIFLFGGLAQAGELIIQPTKKYMEENLFTIFRNKVDVLPSELDGGNAAIIGASALVWNEIND